MQFEEKFIQKLASLSVEITNFMPWRNMAKGLTLSIRGPEGSKVFEKYLLN